ncbi:MAG: glycoside hydrolase family 13 protein [Candidatus Acetothermia bacterium]
MGKPDDKLKHFDEAGIRNLRPPDWVRDTVFYQIFPDRFYNGDPSNNPEDAVTWDANPTRDNFFGGDLAGVMEKLDYLEELGVNGIYLNPIFKSPSNHKYDTTDYYEIDPAFGDASQLKDLVKAAHERNIRVILDGVFNHCGENFPQFQDLKQKGQESEHWNWFDVDDFPPRKEPEPNYRCWAGVPEMPEFDRSNPDVRRFLLDVARYWIDEADIDGWRLDTTNYLEPGFVRSLRIAAREVKSDAYVMGEVVGPAASWFKSGSLDGVMNYELYKLLVDLIAKRRYGPEAFRQRLYFLRRSYPEWANFANYNLLGSHDRPRFMTLCEGDVEIFKLGYFLLFALPGAPAIYYGDEIGMEGGDDPDCRRTFPWKEDIRKKELFSFFQELLKLRKEQRSLRRGEVKEITAPAPLFALVRKTGSELALAAVNPSSKSCKAEIASDQFPTADNPETLFGQGSCSFSSGALKLELPGYGFSLLKLDG